MIHMRKCRPSSASFLSYRISVLTTALDNGARQGFANVPVPMSSLNAAPGPSRMGPSSGAGSESSPQTSKVWIPGPILESVLPALVEAYTARKGDLDVNLRPSPVRMRCLSLLKDILITPIPSSSQCPLP
jgi:hypothetical protein